MGMVGLSTRYLAVDGGEPISRHCTGELGVALLI